jgi:hypothetical protein
MRSINFITRICILSVLFCFTLAGCEIDNYDGPDSAIEGTIFDHLGNPFEANHGAGLIRSRELSWGTEGTHIANRTLNVQQDGTYRHTKMFSGTYRMLPTGGAFFPYDDEHRETNDAGDIVELNKGRTTVKNFTVTPFLTIEWVRKPWIDENGHLRGSIKFTRNQKGDYVMPNVRRGNMQVSRTVNANAALSEYFPADINITNTQEGEEIEFRTVIPLKYSGISYWVRITIECEAVPGNAGTNYQGISARNRSSVERIFYPR